MVQRVSRTDRTPSTSAFFIGTSFKHFQSAMTRDFSEEKTTTKPTNARLTCSFRNPDGLNPRSSYCTIVQFEIAAISLGVVIKFEHYRARRLGAQHPQAAPHLERPTEAP